MKWIFTENKLANKSIFQNFTEGSKLTNQGFVVYLFINRGLNGKKQKKESQIKAKTNQ